MSVWVIPAAVAAFAIAVFAARRSIRRLYAPPHGGRSVAATWAACLGAAGYGWTLGPTSPLPGLGLLTGGAFAGIMAWALWREERNRADGLPDDHTDLPERLGWRRRTTFGIGSLGAAWLATYLAGAQNPGDVLHAWGAVALAATLGAAALTGRPSKRLRRHLGAELTPGQAAEQRRRALSDRRNHESAVRVDEALEQIDRGLR